RHRCRSPGRGGRRGGGRSRRRVIRGGTYRHGGGCMTQPDRARQAAERASAGDPDLPAVRAAQADGAAFATLYRRYLDRVYGYAFYQLGNHHDAEDVTERIFLAAFRALPGFRDEGSSFRAWLFRIAHN